MDFTNDIFTAFLAGRTLIVNEAAQADIEVQRSAAANGMEKVIAATVVHYINDTLGDMAKYGTSDYSAADHNKHWAEMKGYAVGLQYNPFSLISDSELQDLHSLMGQAPAYHDPGSDAYNTTVSNYTRARAILQGAYGFSSTNVEGW